MKRKISVKIAGLIAGAIVVLIMASPVGAQVRNFITLEMPAGTLRSAAWGINARGDVVGNYVDQSSATHGFLWSKGEFKESIDFTDAEGHVALGTAVRGIGPSGDIVGIYWLPGDPASVRARGFLRTQKGEFSNVHFAGHSWEYAQRILPDGTILGCRHDTDLMSTMRGIVIGKDGSSEIDTFGSMHTGATPDLSLIVGLWFNMDDNQNQGYTIENGVFNSFMVPGSNFTEAWDVNPDGVIVGDYRVGTAVHGFVKTGENYTTIDYPGATETRVFGINARGHIVGRYISAGKQYSFLASVVEE